MAKKARFFELTFRDGHGEHTSLFPAQNKDDLLNKLEVPRTVKLVETQHAGWLNVSVEPNEDLDGIEFKVKKNQKETVISKGDLGYEHLTQLFARQVGTLNKALDEHNNPDA